MTAVKGVCQPCRLHHLFFTLYECYEYGQQCLFIQADKPAYQTGRRRDGISFLYELKIIKMSAALTENDRHMTELDDAIQLFPLPGQLYEK